MLTTQLEGKLVITPYKNALPIKFNLKQGMNTLGNTQEYDICINNRQIMNNHCNILLKQDEIELIVQEGLVYFKNEDQTYEQLGKNAVLMYEIIVKNSLNQDSQEYQFRLGKTIEARIQVENIKQKFQIFHENSFNLQDRLSNLQVNIVESQYAQPLFKDTDKDNQISGTISNLNQENNGKVISNDEQESEPQNNDIKQQQLQRFENEQQTEDVKDLLETPDFSYHKMTKQDQKKKLKQTTLDQLLLSKKQPTESSPKKKSQSKNTKDMQKQCSRMSQRRSSRWKLKIAFSGFHPKKQEMQFLLAQNVQFCIDSYDFNILVMEDEIKLRSMKLLIALAKGIPIISKDWLTKSIDQFEILDYNQFEAKFSNEFCEKNNFNIDKHNKRVSKRKFLPLSETHIILPRNITYHVTHIELEILIEELGGTVIADVLEENTKMIILVPRGQELLSNYDKNIQVPIENLFKCALEYKNML